MKKLKFLLPLLTAIFLISCSSDDKPTPVNEEELITSVITTLTGGGATYTLSSRDLDGDGPNAPIVSDAVTLAANTTYTGTVTFLNEMVNPAENLNTEINEEATEHQIFYSLQNATFTYTDFDENGKPVGLTFTLTTGNDALTTNFSIILRHLPNKTAAGVSNGDITNAGGSTDAQVAYPIIIQ